MASIRYIDFLKGSYNGNYPPEHVLDTDSTRCKRPVDQKAGSDPNP